MSGTIQPALTEGEHQLELIITDLAGNQATIAGLSFTLNLPQEPTEPIEPESPEGSRLPETGGDYPVSVLASASLLMLGLGLIARLCLKRDY